MENRKSLIELGKKHGTDKYTHGYLSLYEEVLSKIDIKSLMEIGIRRGYSMTMRKEYLPNARIVGVDINSPLGLDGIEEYQIDVMSKEFEKIFGGQMFDVIIDDGGHFMSQQKTAFNKLRNSINPGGVFIMEDICTSFRPMYMNEKPTTYEYLLQFCADNNIEYKEYWGSWESKLSGTMILFKK